MNTKCSLIKQIQKLQNIGKKEHIQAGKTTILLFMFPITMLLITVNGLKRNIRNIHSGFQRLTNGNTLQMGVKITFSLGATLQIVIILTTID